MVTFMATAPSAQEIAIEGATNFQFDEWRPSSAGISGANDATIRAPGSLTQVAS